MHPFGLAAAGLCFVSIPALGAPEGPKKTILETATAAGSFKTLLTAVRAAGLEEALGQKGPFTVFAPTDAAFAKLPRGTLATLLDPANRATLSAILRFHVVAGRVDAATALQAGTAKTLADSTLRISLRDGRLRVQGATVTQNDVETANGVIHIIDSVLLPTMSKSNAVIEATPKSLIETAIERGVPLFNNGQQAACAAVYEVAVRGLLQASSVSSKDRAALAQALRKAAGQSPTDAAWTLRGVLDRVYETAQTTRTATSRVKPARRMATVFEFDDAEQARQFRPLNDSVMGGRSDSRMEAGDNTAVFAGTVSLENRGGFASVRTAVARGSLAGSKGLVMRVRGDGRTYRLTVRKNRASYDIEFPTEAGKWIEVELPFAKLRRNIRGYRPNSAAPQGRDLTSLGVLIGDKTAGPFRLEIDWIRAYAD